MALLTLSIRITDTAEIHLTDTTCYQPIDGLFDIVLIELPETGKVIHHAIGDDTQRDALPHLLLLHHQTVCRIVECRVTAHDDDSLVTIGDHHLHQSFHTVGGLTLHEVIVHLALVENLLDLLPALALVTDACFGAIQDTPLCRFYCHLMIYDFRIYNLRFV